MKTLPGLVLATALLAVATVGARPGHTKVADGPVPWPKLIQVADGPVPWPKVVIQTADGPVPWPKLNHRGVAPQHSGSSFVVAS